MIEIVFDIKHGLGLSGLEFFGLVPP